MSPEITYLLTTWDGCRVGKLSITFENRNEIPHDVREYYLEPESREWFRTVADLDSEVIDIDVIDGHTTPIMPEPKS